MNKLQKIEEEIQKLKKKQRELEKIAKQENIEKLNNEINNGKKELDILLLDIKSNEKSENINQHKIHLNKLNEILRCFSRYDYTEVCPSETELNLSYEIYNTTEKMVLKQTNFILDLLDKYKWKIDYLV